MNHRRLLIGTWILGILAIYTLQAIPALMLDSWQESRIQHSNTVIEDFEQYTAGDNMQGKIGPIGNWTTSVAGSNYARAYDESGNTVMDVYDGSGSSGSSAKLALNNPGTINGENVAGWRQKILVAGAHNIILWEGANFCVQVQFTIGGQVNYFSPDHGGLLSTGLTFGTGWESYEIKLYSTAQFLLRQYKNSAWSTWQGPFDNRVHWSSTGAVFNAWDIDGSTPSMPHVYIDDVAMSWYDVTPPTITVTSPSNGAVFGTSSIPLNVQVVDTDLDSIWYILDSGTAVMMPTNTSINVADGAHSITFYANDTLGHVNSVTRSFMVDTTAPVVHITSPASGSNLSSGSVNVIFTATDLTKDDTWYTVNGGAPTIVTGSSFLLSLPDGSYTVMVYCNDSFGRLTSNSISFSIDTANPIITVISPSSGAILGSSSVLLSANVIDPYLASIWYVLDGGPITLMPTNTSITVADGAHSITFYANDTLGHVNSVTRSFTVDTIAPVVHITSPASGSNLSSGSVNVTFTATDLTKDDTWYTVNGGAPTIVTGSSFLLSLPDGSYTVMVYCNDSAGRVSSDGISILVDETKPFIAVSGFAGLGIMQGDAQYLNWTLSDAHPAIYTLWLNGQVILAGLFNSGAKVSVLIDSSMIRQLNYTLIVEDTFGNVQRHERLITVSSRTDGGIFLQVGLNTHHHGGAIGLDLTLNMNHWAVLYLNVDLSIATAADLHLGELPSGWEIAVPVAFNLTITNSSALANGYVRVFYSQDLIARQVHESSLKGMVWRAGSWTDSGGMFNLTDNHVDIPLTTVGLYIIVGNPKPNYTPIIIIVLIGITGGIIAAASYNYSRKKSIKMKAGSKGKEAQARSYSATITNPAAPDTPSTITGPEGHLDAAMAKRARLMQDVTTGTRRILEPVKKLKPSPEQVVDLASRRNNAADMAREVQVEQVVPKCIVHKGPISGFSYSCSACGVIYCMACVKHLSETNQKCWNCEEPLRVDIEQATRDSNAIDSPPETVVSVISKDVWEKIDKLGLQDDILDEVLGKLKLLPPAARISYLERVFPDDEQLDGNI